jgi:hypothetical protein
MKRLAILAASLCLLAPPEIISSIAAVSLESGTPGSSQTAEESADTLVFADFETVKDGRPVSNRGGFITMSTYEQNPANKSRFKGQKDVSPPAPELVRIDRNSTNRAAAFEYEMAAPNQWSGIILEIHGQPDQDGKPVPDDVSGYKYLTAQIYVTPNGIQTIRAEFISRGQGVNLEFGFPQMNFKVEPGKMNTYKIELKKLAQPRWVEDRYDTSTILKKLTSIQLAAFCEPCTPLTGTVVVDNLVFHKK